MKSRKVRNSVLVCLHARRRPRVLRMGRGVSWMPRLGRPEELTVIGGGGGRAGVGGKRRAW